ncbi:MAG: PilZ domain-containing protein [Candidatus Eiseniibacteriota bacterium]
MPPKPRVLEQVLDAYREGDLDECIRLVRTLVEAAPQATAPRQLLAALFASTGNGRQALAHYRRLLPLAVARGEVIRSIAFQKQIDVYEQPEGLAPGRWPTLQRQLREKGLPFIGEAPGGAGRPWTESQLLALPRAWFERIAADTRFEIVGLEPRALDVEAGTVWEVLAGRVRWSFALPDGRASAESLAAEGDAVHVDPVLARTARVSLVPELPVEALRFEAELARDLKLALTAGLHVTATAVAGLTHETRALLPIRPRRREDLDDLPRAPLPNAGTEPLQLPPPSEAGEPASVAGDGAGWVEFGVLSLSETPASSDPDAPGSDGASGTTPSPPEAGAGTEPPSHAKPEPEPSLDLPPVEPQPSLEGAGSTGEFDRDRPAVVSGVPTEEESIPAGLEPADRPAEEADVPAPLGTPEPVDAAEPFLVASGPDPFAATIGDPETQVERRRHPRVSVSLASRLALLRLTGSRVTPVEGQLADLSTSGFSIRFSGQGLGPSRGALVDAVVAVDLDLPGPRGALRLAAQVRWLEVDEAKDEVRLGIEFVLLTEPDRRRIAGTLAQAALAEREQGRKAA